MLRGPGGHLVGLAFPVLKSFGPRRLRLFNRKWWGDPILRRGKCVVSTEYLTNCNVPRMVKREQGLARYSTLIRSAEYGTVGDSHPTVIIDRKMQTWSTSV